MRKSFCSFIILGLLACQQSYNNIDVVPIDSDYEKVEDFKPGAIIKLIRII